MSDIHADALREPEMDRAPWRITGWHVLGALCAFFAVIITVNAIFLSYALDTFSGIETRDAYRQGLAYNERISADRAAAHRGWSGTVGLSDAGTPHVVLRRLDGEPLTGMVVTGKIGRPSTDRFDRPVTFTERSSGVYEAVDVTLAPGNWIVTAAVQNPVVNTEDALLRIKERLWVSQQ